MCSNETRHLIEVLKARHRVAILYSTLRNLEHSREFNPEDDAFREIQEMFQHRIDLELSSIAEPAD